MVKLLYEICPRCNETFVFRPISIFDSDGKTLGFFLGCKKGSWFSMDRFYSYDEVMGYKKENGLSKPEIDGV